MSFGNYLTRLELDNLGPVLVVGELEDQGSNRSKNNNGAGKSSLISAVIYALFGRTSHLPNPGDRVINHDIGKNCTVRLETVDGYIIERNRKVDGKDDLLFYESGNPDASLSTNKNAQRSINLKFGLDYGVFASSVFFEQRGKPILDLGPTVRQRILERMLQLHKLNDRADVADGRLKDETYKQDKFKSELEIFTRDYDRLTKEVEESKQNRSSHESRRIDKIAEIESRISEAEKEHNSITVPDLEKLSEKWDAYEQIQEKHEEYKTKRDDLSLQIKYSENNINSFSGQLEDAKSTIKNRKEIDVENLKLAWGEYEKQNEVISALVKEQEKAEKEIDKVNFKIEEIQKTIKDWQDKSGTTCPTCKQEVSEEHTGHLCKPYINNLENYVKDRSKLNSSKDKFIEAIEREKEELARIKPDMHIEYAEQIIKDIGELSTKIEYLEDKIKENEEKIVLNKKELESTEAILIKISTTITQYKPTTTLKEVESIIKNRDGIKSNIEMFKKAKDEIKNDTNPYAGHITKLEDAIKKNGEDSHELKDKISKEDILIRYLNYIKKAYKDRNKIKKFLLNGLVPLLNDRLRYYLDQFGFDVLDLQFNNLLKIESDKWDYSQCSGGERQCIDLALMFAMYDLNTVQYGRQSNIMVLDEVDGRLDGHNVEALASVIIDDFGNKGVNRPSSILVVSHKDDMFDAFPTKIRVKKKKGFSYLEIED